MTKMKEQILELCEEICGRKVTSEEQLISTGMLDSFQIMDMVCRLEEIFHITFLPEEIMDLDKFSSVDLIAAFVSEKKA